MDVILSGRNHRNYNVTVPSPWPPFDSAVQRYSNMQQKLELAFRDAEAKKQAARDARTSFEAALAEHLLNGGKKPVNEVAEKEREAEEASTLVEATRLAGEQAYDAIVAVVEENREQWSAAADEAAAAAAAEEGKKLGGFLAARERRLDLEFAGRFARGFPQNKSVRGGFEVVVDGVAGRLRWQQVEDTLRREAGILPPAPRTLPEHVAALKENADAKTVAA